MKEWNDQKIQDWLDQQGRNEDQIPVDQTEDHQVYTLLYQSLKTEPDGELSDGFVDAVMVRYQESVKKEQKLMQQVMMASLIVIGLLSGYLVFSLLDFKPVVKALFGTVYSYKWHLLFAFTALTLFQYAEQRLLKRKAAAFGIALR